jgi:membrane protease YdiL (CAAX protease family)
VRACTSSEPSSSSFLRFAIAGEAGMLVVAWAGGYWLGISPLERLHPSLGALALGVAATVPMCMGLAWTLTTPWRRARELVDLVVEQLGPVLAGRPTFQLAFLAALAGIGEEVLFRGVVQVGLERWLPDTMALVAASVIFGVAHFASSTYAALAGVVGLYLGTLFLLQGNLLVPIVAHSLYDFIALIFVVRRHRAAQPSPLD